MPSITELFKVESGEGPYRKNAGVGDTPLISATTENNGVLAFVDVDPTFEAPAITVERVSGKAFVQLDDFATVPDDMAVLKPKVEMSLEELFRIASQINAQRWRYSYSRKLTPSRLAEMEVSRDPSSNEDFDSILSAVGIELPRSKQRDKSIPATPERWKKVEIGKHFDLQHGDFNALPKEPGKVPTVSRSSTDNGIKGYFLPPEGAQVYSPPKITVSTVSGKAFVQFTEFIASDKVVILTSKHDMSLEEWYFFQAMIDYESWRYSYGRSCFKSKLASKKIYLPFTRDGALDRSYMEGMVGNASYWKYVERNCSPESVSYQQDSLFQERAVAESSI